MRLRVRYENVITEIELTDKDFDSLWVSLELQGDGLSQQEKNDLLQIEFDKKFNKPEYNSWRRFKRKIECLEIKTNDGSTKILDIEDLALWEDDPLNKIDYDNLCSKVRSILAKKPCWAEAVIAIQIDGMSVNDYAASISKEPSCISHWLERAKRKLRNEYARHTEEVL